MAAEHLVADESATVVPATAALLCSRHCDATDTLTKFAA